LKTDINFAPSARPYIMTHYAEKRKNTDYFSTLVFGWFSAEKTLDFVILHDFPARLPRYAPRPNLTFPKRCAIF
jgi:hypothetical protein